MPLISLKNVAISFQTVSLFEGVNFVIEPNERTCLVGRNGAGKSTLLKIMAGKLAPDEGEVVLSPGTKRAEMAQAVPGGEGGTVYDVVAGGVGEVGEAVAKFHKFSSLLAAGNDPGVAEQLDEAQHTIEALDGWDIQNKIERTLSRIKLDGEQGFEMLSAGMKRRVLLARALVGEPDLLLLDEPTNHLDIEAIIWLEEFLRDCDPSIVFVTHDRAFARKLSNRVLDLDRGKVTSWNCGYTDYLVRKQAALEAEEKQAALFEKRLAQEEVWIRQGIKARRTRNEGRVRALKKMREQFQNRRTKTGSVSMEAHQADRSGQMVFKAENLWHKFDDLKIVSGFSTMIMREEKIGIVGRNGIGKTTLLKILLGQLPPEKGTVKVGTNVEIAYFDQLHARLDEHQTLRENIGEGNEFVTINGKRKHVVGYLQEFLFSSEQANRAIKYLSGGERNRLLLARLFAKPSNVLVLDEPTNDLDADTLELLEDLLINYQGTILVVSHDREFLNNVATSIIAFEGDGEVHQYPGGYDDYLVQRDMVDEPAKGSLAVAETSVHSDASKAATGAAKGKANRGRKLSYKEQRELDTLPKTIEQLEAEQEKLQQVIADPDFYQQPAEKIKEVTTQLEKTGTQILTLMQRWEELATIAEDAG